MSRSFRLLLAGALVLMLAPVPAVAGVGECYGPRGSTAEDKFDRYDTGGPGPNTYDRRPYGRERACWDGRGGDDLAYGGPFRDLLMGAGDSDVLYGGLGADTLNGDDGADYADGGRGFDVVYGGRGDDQLRGGPKQDLLFGADVCTETNYWGYWGLAESGADDDMACGHDGSDRLIGGSGDDWIWEGNSDNFGDGAFDYINGGAGMDDCTGGPEDVIVNCEHVHVLKS